jgi:hypothetical protein
MDAVQIRSDFFLLNSAPTISPVCPHNVFKHNPEYEFHILAVLSNEPVTILSHFG